MCDVISLGLNEWWCQQIRIVINFGHKSAGHRKVLKRYWKVSNSIDKYLTKIEKHWKGISKYDNVLKAMKALESIEKQKVLKKCRQSIDKVLKAWWDTWKHWKYWKCWNVLKRVLKTYLKYCETLKIIDKNSKDFGKYWNLLNKYWHVLTKY